MKSDKSQDFFNFDAGRPRENTEIGMERLNITPLPFRKDLNHSGSGISSNLNEAILQGLQGAKPLTSYYGGSFFMDRDQDHFHLKWVGIVICSGIINGLGLFVMGELSNNGVHELIIMSLGYSLVGIIMLIGRIIYELRDALAHNESREEALLNCLTMKECPAYYDFIN